MAAALEEPGRAYGEVVDFIGAITNATDWSGRGIAGSQKATIDLLSDDSRAPGPAGTLPTGASRPASGGAETD